MPFVAYLLCNLSLSLHEQLDLRPTLKQLAADEVRTLQEPLPEPYRGWVGVKP